MDNIRLYMYMGLLMKSLSQIFAKSHTYILSLSIMCIVSKLVSREE